MFKSGWVCLSPVGPEVHSPPCTPLSVTAQAEGSGRQAMPLVRCNEFCSCSGCSFKGDSKFENLLFCQKGLFELSENQLEEGDNYKSHCLARRAVLSFSRSVFPGQSSALQTSSKGKKRSTANSHCQFKSYISCCSAAQGCGTIAFVEGRVSVVTNDLFG